MLKAHGGSIALNSPWESARLYSRCAVAVALSRATGAVAPERRVGPPRNSGAGAALGISRSDH
jgi:hypothetical protein